MEINLGKSMIDTEIKALCLLRDNLTKSFTEAINILHKTSGKIILSGIGKSGHICKKISSTFSSIGCPSFFVHPSEANHGDLGMISKNESIILISNSGETSELLNIILHCKKLKVPIIAITSNSESTLAKKCTVLLEIPKNIEACPLELAPTSSTTVSLVLGDALALTLLKKNDFTKQKFSELHPGGKLGRMLLKVNDVMKTSKNMPLVNENQKMSSVILEITSKGFGCVGVISKNQEKLIGIITDGDLRRFMDEKILEKKANEIMTKQPIIINKNAFIYEALEFMNKKKITNCFIVENKKPIGILHVHDILKY